MKNRKTLYHLALSFLGLYIFSISSCKEDSVIDPGSAQFSAFFQLDSGFWAEYYVDSVVHLDADDQFDVDTSIETYHFFIREQIDSSYKDATGNKAWVISRYKRTSDTLPWEFTSLWTAKLTANSLERIEDNQRYIKLVFPIKANKQWDGNAYNTLGEEDYKYENVYQTFTADTLSFDSAVTVNQNEFVSNVNLILKKEIYGKNVGLLSKTVVDYTSKIISTGTIVLNGLEYQQTILDYKH